MIKINLLGSDSEVDIEGRLLLAAFVLVFVLTFGGASYFTSIRSAEVTKLAEQQKRLEKELKTLSEKTKLVRELEAKKDLVKQKLAVIAKLKKSKIGPVRVLDDFNIALPPRVWITEVNEDKGAFRIVGRALGNQDVAVFMKNLGASDYFETVELQESRQMYYDKATGDVKSTKPVHEVKGTAFASKKGKKIKIEDKRKKKKGPGGKERKDKTRRQKVEPSLPIKEFVLKAKVNYAGKLGISEEKSEEKKGKA